MFKAIFLGVFVSFVSVASLAAAKAVRACAMSSYDKERVEEVSQEVALDVFNSQGEIVGALEYDSASGKIHSLYLCGRNSGFYYAEGNLWAGQLDAIYNDEYDAEFVVARKGSVLKISLLSVKFVGEPEDADYPPFSAEIFVKIPVR
ncbi:hypothetical protein QJS83_11625 [Bdellovibrio sp. 22V]|uniref:hypothetical protein n=1 Tax=Bdellovibrio sp. 22V TaxID=3044166 RepID=UPI0025437E6B|nr:hypothetical protein [Bdellovibrio sp. 22V]WII71110.1 hypothetical protein QJS83_11625 [Bdellovibrio sp. 22V]